MKGVSHPEEPPPRDQEVVAVSPHRSSGKGLNAHGAPGVSATALGARRRLSESVVPLLQLSDAQMSILAPRRSSCGSRHASWMRPRSTPDRPDERTIVGSATKTPTTSSFPGRANLDDDPSKSSLQLPPKSPARQPSWISSTGRSGTSRSDGDDNHNESLPSQILMPTEPPPQPPARVVLSFAQASTLSASSTAGASPALRRIVSAPAYRMDALMSTPESSGADPLDSVGPLSHPDLAADRWSSRSSVPTPPRPPQVTCPLLRSMSLDMAVPVPRRRGSACGGGANANPDGGSGCDPGAVDPTGDDGPRWRRPRSTSLDEPALVPTRQGSFRIGRMRPKLRRDRSRRLTASPHAHGPREQTHPNMEGSGRNCRGLDTRVGDPETFLPPSCQHTIESSDTNAIGFTSKPATTCPAEIFITTATDKVSNRESFRFSSATDPLETSEDATSVSSAQCSPNHTSARPVKFTKAVSLPCVTSLTKDKSSTCWRSNKKPSMALPESVQRLVRRSRSASPTESTLQQHGLGRFIHAMANVIRKDSHHKQNSCDKFLLSTEFMEPSSLFMASSTREHDRDEGKETPYSGPRPRQKAIIACYDI